MTDTNSSKDTHDETPESAQVEQPEQAAPANQDEREPSVAAGESSLQAAAEPTETSGADEIAADGEAAAAGGETDDTIADPDDFEVSDEKVSGIEASGIDNVIEALLLASEIPLSLDSLQRLIGADFNAGRSELRAALARLAERYESTSMHVNEVAGGWRIQVKQDYAHWVGRLYQEKPPKLSRATLETLALIVYRQPITRGEIESVRGVAVSSNILRTLLERGWIREVGHKEAPGRPALFGTTQQLLDDFGLKSLDQLPGLPEVKDADQLEAALARLVPGGGGGHGSGDGESGEIAVTELAGTTTAEGAPQDATIH
jgi:segregation and condensation protein B